MSYEQNTYANIKGPVTSTPKTKRGPAFLPPSETEDEAGYMVPITSKARNGDAPVKSLFNGNKTYDETDNEEHIYETIGDGTFYEDVDGDVAPPSQAPPSQVRKPSTVPIINREVVIDKPDPYFKSPVITQLSFCTFPTVLENNDKVFIFFYDTNMKKDRSEEKMAKKNFIKAAESSQLPNVAFRTVDCTKSTKLCADENIETFPFVSLYNKGVRVGSFRETTTLSSEAMKGFMEKL